MASMKWNFQHVGQLLLHFFQVLRQNLTTVILCLITVIFVLALGRAWLIQTNQPVTCQLAFGGLDKSNGYLEIQLSQQHPIEPYFSGQLFMLSVDPNNSGITSVLVNRSAERTYGISEYNVPMVWDNDWHGLRSRSPTPFDLVTEGHSHQYFPLDSAVFDFDLTLKPLINFKVLRLVNRTPGFVLDCAKCRAAIDPSGRIHISFPLDRSPLVILAVIVFGVASLGFVPLIMMLTKIEDLAVSIASYFFSIWSFRGILSSEIKTFPTLFDCWLLSVCMFIIIWLWWKVKGMKKRNTGQLS